MKRRAVAEDIAEDFERLADEADRLGLELEDYYSSLGSKIAFAERLRAIADKLVEGGGQSEIHELVMMAYDDIDHLIEDAEDKGLRRDVRKLEDLRDKFGDLHSKVEQRTLEKIMRRCSSCGREIQARQATFGDVKQAASQKFGDWVNFGDMNYASYGGVQVKYKSGLFEYYRLITPDSGYPGWILESGAVTEDMAFEYIDNNRFDGAEEAELRMIRFADKVQDVMSPLGGGRHKELFQASDLEDFDPEDVASAWSETCMGWAVNSRNPREEKVWELGRGYSDRKRDRMEEDIHDYLEGLGLDV